MAWVRLCLIGCFAVGIVRCSEEAADPVIAPGTEGWPCPNDNNCLVGFRCVAGACAPVAPIRGPVDAGQVPDAAPLVDAGIDAGVDAGDAGIECTEPATLAFIQTNIFGPPGQPSCNQGTCHGQAGAGGLTLIGPAAAVRQNLLGATRTVGAPEPFIVDPGSPDTSRLYVVMRDRNPVGAGDPMPPGAPVPFCDLETVRKWIADGALAN